jgi:hypothetical protein
MPAGGYCPKDQKVLMPLISIQSRNLVATEYDGMRIHVGFVLVHNNYFGGPNYHCSLWTKEFFIR